MKCSELRKFVDAYVDQELDPGHAMLLDEHLQSCPQCRARMEFTRRLKAEIHSKYADIKAPAQLREKISKIESSRNVLRIFRPAVLVPVAAAACALFALFIFRPDTPEQALTPDIGMAVAAEKAAAADRKVVADTAIMADIIKPHLVKLPLDIQNSDQKAVSEWFRGRVNFPVQPPVFRSQRVNLVGARLSNVRQHQAAQLSYDLDGKNVSMTIFHPEDAASMPAVPARPADAMITHNRGYTVGMFSNRGIAYAISGNIDEEQMKKLISSLSQQ